MWPKGLPTELTVSTVWTMTQVTQALRPVGGPSQIEENVRQVTRMLMKRDGITLPTLALRLGVSRTAVSNRLGGPAPFSGKKPFTLAEVGILSEMFALPAAVFLTGPTALLGGGAGVVSVGKSPLPLGRSGDLARYRSRVSHPAPRSGARIHLTLLHGVAA